MEELKKKVTASLKNSSIQHTWSVIHGYIHCRCLAWDSSILVVDHIVDISGIKQTSSRNPPVLSKRSVSLLEVCLIPETPLQQFFLLSLSFVHRELVSLSPRTMLSSLYSMRMAKLYKDHVVVLTQLRHPHCTVKYSQVFYSSRSQISQTWWPTLCVS